MATPLHVLMLEDSNADVELMLISLRQAGFDPIVMRGETEREFREHLPANPEVILSDFSMPEFDALTALEILQETKLKIPFIIVSGSIGEERAVQVMQHGATDYVIKDRMVRLGHAVTQALEQKRLREEKLRTEEALRKSEEVSQKAQEAVERDRELNRFAQEKALAINEALLISGLHQHELTDEAERLNELLKAEIAERKLAQAALGESLERFRIMAESMPQKICTANTDGSVEYFNQQWMDYTGLAFEEIKGWGWKQFIHPEDLEETVRSWKHTVKSGQDLEIGHRYRHRDGVYRWHLTRVAPSRTSDGEILMWIGSSTDVHDQKLMIEKLAEADRNKDEFLAMLAHELRNPLVPIKSAAEVLRLSNIDDPAVMMAQAVIERQANHMIRLVNDLLDTSRIQQRKVSLHLKQVELKRLISRVLEDIRPALVRNPHTLIQDVNASVPIFIEGDPERLEQVFTNLLNNAIKYTPENGTIHVTVEHESNWAIIRIRDNGIGIESKMLERIFELFTQVDNALDRSQGGLGLGLKLARELVKMHGGTIEATSAGLGKGSEFIVRLKTVSESNSNLNTVLKKLNQNTVSRRILLIDDNTDILESMQLMLRMQGHILAVAKDGEQGVELAANTAFDLILVDVGLPGINGYEVAKRIRTQPGSQHAVLIALTGYGEAKDKLLAEEAGFDEHFVKPMAISDLVDVLENLEKYHAR